MRFSTIPIIAALAKIGAALYVIEDNYPISSAFFDHFNFITGEDPTHGYVQFVDRAAAQSADYISIKDNAVYIGADHSNVATSSGRQSVHMSSVKTYTRGLFIVDLGHMPDSICGTWPAVWTVGPTWPNDGEINIIEGVNQQTRNRMTLHTNTGCSINNSGFYGELITDNCGETNQSAKVGCSIDSYSSTSYGGGFNHIGGGVYALEWTSSAINIWFFPRGSVPANVDSLSPDPSTWGTPTTRLSDTCDIDHHFRNHSIFRSTDFRYHVLR
ncbi:hypothetical protein Egran_04331 [Elaphomyces granulatus]|uniref:GH16 domain-containing protein n=1 Tax=Elaphomyces granulatus TaxID=519963 RepID=A0A232LUS6_9EURO|nr:hypothetical protein Egran_04331 [Elaphomyces granulatus]